MTLETKQGNAFDTASLLIALLRASGIHARYAYGTVRIPIESVRNWVGGVTKPEAAIQLLAQGGIPVVAQTQGGVIKFAKLEQVWVEAWIDFIPSRGAKHQTGDSWVPLDASFKQYQFTTGMDLQQAVPFDTQGVIEHLTQTSQFNETEGWVSGIDQNYLQTTLQSYQTPLENYLTQTPPEATGQLYTQVVSVPKSLRYASSFQHLKEPDGLSYSSKSFPNGWRTRRTIKGTV